MRNAATLLVSIVVSVLTACRAAAPASLPVGGEAPIDDPVRIAIEAVLDDFHRAASEPDGARYFGHMTEHAVFLGTDATERWSRAEFEAFAAPYFDSGQGWTYEKLERHVYLAPDAATAWFDERLWNESYGECRGTGVLRRAADVWRIAHYNLVFPIPNDLAGEFTAKIKEVQGDPR